MSSGPADAKADRPGSQQKERSRVRVPAPTHGRPPSSSKDVGASRSRRSQGASASTLNASEALGKSTVSDVWTEDDPEALRKRFREIDERRYREWNNYQVAQRSDDQTTGSSFVFIDLSIGDGAPQRLVIELFPETPITAANFRALLLGERGFDAATGVKLDYIDSQCWRVVPGSGMWLGELGQGVSLSANGGTFEDENFANRHTQRGTLSMASQGPNTNGSGFFVSFDKTRELDFQQVVFGRVIEGIAALDTVEAIGTSRNGTPTTPIAISFCGALSGRAPQKSMPDDVLSPTNAPIDGDDSTTAPMTIPAPETVDDSEPAVLASTVGSSARPTSDEGEPHVAAADEPKAESHASPSSETASNAKSSAADDATEEKDGAEKEAAATTDGAAVVSPEPRSADASASVEQLRVEAELKTAGTE